MPERVRPWCDLEPPESGKRKRLRYRKPANNPLLASALTPSLPQFGIDNTKADLQHF